MVKTSAADWSHSFKLVLHICRLSHLSSMEGNVTSVDFIIDTDKHLIFISLMKVWHTRVFRETGRIRKTKTAKEPALVRTTRY